MATNQRSKLGYQPGMGNEGIKTIHRVVPVSLFLVAGLTDGEGKKENRIVLRFPGNKQFFFMFPKGTEAAMRPASGWLQDLLEKSVSEEGQDASIPDDLVDNVPVGDPLGE